MDPTHPEATASEANSSPGEGEAPGQLSAAESRVRDAAISGTGVNLADGSTPPDDRLIRAAWLADFMAGIDSSRWHAAELQIAGAHITGPADWSGRRFPIFVELKSCEF